MAEFAAIAGSTEAEGASYMEMAGGNLEAALTIFFDGGGAALAAPPQAAASAETLTYPDWWDAVWPKQTRVPVAWSEQSFDFGAGGEGVPPFGLLQPKNGPCGVLAAVHAKVAARCFGESGFGRGTDARDFAVSDDLLSAALADMLLAARAPGGKPTAPCVLAAWSSSDADVSSPEAVRLAPIGPGELLAAIKSRVAEFRGAGGVLLFLYSLVHTRGIEQIKSEALELPLVYGNFWVCSSELVALVLRGVADGNVGAYGAGGGKNDIEPLDVGIISMTAVTSSIPMADAYLNPTTPVWLLHGTDHFTVLFADKEIAERSEED